MLIAFSGRLEEQDGSAIASSVSGAIEMIYTRWKGRVTLDASTARWLNTHNGPIRLVLSSGERGDLFVTSVHHGDGVRIPVYFRGTGALRQPDAGAFGLPTSHDRPRLRSAVTASRREQMQLTA